MDCARARARSPLARCRMSGDPLASLGADCLRFVATAAAVSQTQAVAATATAAATAAAAAADCCRRGARARFASKRLRAHRRATRGAAARRRRHRRSCQRVAALAISLSQLANSSSFRLAALCRPVVARQKPQNARVSASSALYATACRHKLRFKPSEAPKNEFRQVFA